MLVSAPKEEIKEQAEEKLQGRQRYNKDKVHANYKDIFQALREIDQVFVTAEDIDEVIDFQGEVERLANVVGMIESLGAIEEYGGSPARYLNGYNEDHEWHLYPDSYWNEVENAIDEVFDDLH